MHLSRLAFRAGILALFALIASGCAAFPPGTPLPDILHEINATLQPNEILLQPGDGINVQALNSKELNQTTTIRPDGKASFLYLGEVEVAGLSVSQLHEMLTRLYDKEVVAGELLVRAGNLSEREIHFMGAVRGRASIRIGPGMTIDLIEALARVGGAKDTFTLIEHTVLIRWMPDEEKRRHWVIDASQKYWANPELLHLQAGDIVYIPTHPIRIWTQWMREITKLLPLPRIIVAEG